MTSPDRVIYRFGQFELEPRERRLLGDGKPITLAPKVFDTLVLLVERAGRVATKDELMQALWPRGFVDEATLSNHIWQIRRALGVSAKNTDLIETVPKLGYRFTAAVTTVAPGAPPLQATTASEPQPTLPSFRPRRVLKWNSLVLAGAATVFALLAWNVLWLRVPAPSATRATAPLDGTGQAAPALAIVGFDSLSRVAADAWLSRTLVAMLETDFGASPSIRLVPFTDVLDAGRDVAAPVAGGYGPDALSALRHRVGADYVLSGHYLLGAGGEDPTLRIDFALQDARSGALLAVTSVESRLSGMNGLLAQVADAARAKLDIPVPDAKTAGQFAAAQPPTPETARHLGLAFEAMDRNDTARSRDELMEVVAQAPGYAAGGLQLAKAWWALGYRQKALAAAEQARRRSTELPLEWRLQIDALIATAGYDAAGAAAAWKELVARQPHAMQFRIARIDAALEAGDAAGAQAVAVDLRRMPEAAGEPRAFMALARAAAAIDAKASAEFAAEALHLANGREARALSADATLGVAQSLVGLGKDNEAAEELTAAVADYHVLGNAYGEAAARRVLARTWDRLHRGADARDEYQRAMTLSQRIGDRGGVGAVYREFSAMFWFAGDRDAAQIAARRALEVGRETGDLQLQSWTLRALATIAADDAVTDEVIADYEQVTALAEGTHDAGGHAWSLATTADSLRIRGQLAEAQSICDRVREESAKLRDPQYRVYGDFTCALLSLDRGAAAEARAAFERVVRLAPSSAIAVYVPNARLLLGQIDYEAGQLEAARAELHQAIAGFVANEAQTGEADAEALLALCANSLGDGPERARAAARAAKLRGGITAKQEIYFVDIALAQLADTPSQRTAAIAQLRELAADAERRHFMSWALEAKLAEWELLRTDGDGPRTSHLGNELAATARQSGFGRIGNLMDRARVQAPGKSLIAPASGS